jgi:hypothetical protein
LNSAMAPISSPLSPLMDPAGPTPPPEGDVKAEQADEPVIKRSPKEAHSHIVKPTKQSVKQHAHRGKPKSATTPPPSLLSASPPKRHQTHLRTAARSAKRGIGGSKRRPDEESDTESRARAAHNQVEQHYRQRLNAYFEKLLAVLPAVDMHGEGGSDEDEPQGSSSGNQRRKVSKAEVLDLARRRIEALEWEVETLQRDKKELARAREQMAKALGRRANGLSA